MTAFAESLKRAAAAYPIELTMPQIHAYNLYYERLIEWNEKMNLTAITEPDQVARKHIIDSLSCYDPEVFSVAAKVVDVGTGAGFPGLPLKIWKADLQLTLLDSLQKRVNFLSSVVEELSLAGVDAVHCRAEEGGRRKEYRETYDVAVSRAVARLSILCELCLPFVRVGGSFIALKGARYREEADQAERAIRLLGGEIEKIKPVKLPGINDARAVVYIKKVKKTPPTYPRKAGTPEKNPL